jgi:hypothetical protein
MASRRELERLPAALRLDVLTLDLDARLKSTPHLQSTTNIRPMRSNNPYARYGASDSALVRSTSQELQQFSSETRKQAPPRAVFHDLSTAHSSITSGSARSRPQPVSHNLQDIRDDEEEDSFQLQDLKPITSSHGYEVHLPPLPKPIAIPRGRPIDTSDLDDQEDDLDVSLPPLPRPPQELSMFTSIKNVIGAIGKSAGATPQWPRKESSSVYHTHIGGAQSTSIDPGTQEHRTGDGRLYPGYHAHGHDREPYKEVMHFEDFPSTPEPADQNILSLQLSSELETPVPDYSSLHDGSTIGNIYNHYVGSNADEKEGEGELKRGYFLSHSSSSQSPLNDFESHGHLQPSALNIRKQRRADRALDIRHEVGSSLISSEGASSPPNFVASKPTNPFRSTPTPKVVVSHHPDDTAQISHGYNNPMRPPLEREVSEALRRVSNYSTCSNESVSTVPLRFETYQSSPSASKTKSSAGRQALKHLTSSSQSESIGDEIGDHAKNFYDQDAIPSHWILGKQKAIRIPINRTGHFPASSPASPPDAKATEHVYEDDPDVNDWETVDDRSHFGIGKSCGSSRADNSVCDSDSDYVPEIQNFSSKDRIVQHPSPMGQVIHRQRNLKNMDGQLMETPVLLPVFGEHKVNGQLSNTTRFPQVPYTAGNNPITPHPIPTTHRHPFRTPPEVMKSPHERRNLNLSPASINTFTTIEVSTTNARCRPSSPTQKLLPDSSWADFGEPGPAFIGPPGRKLQLDPMYQGKRDEINSWQHLITLGNGGTVPGFDPDGTRSANADKTNNLMFPPRAKGQSDSYNREPLVKGPPGNFYRGVAGREPKAGMNKPKSRPTRLPDGFHNMSKKMSPKEMRKQWNQSFPTDRLRPFSLSLDSRASTATLDRMRPSYHKYKECLNRRKKETGKSIFTRRELQQLDREALAEVEMLNRNGHGFDSPPSLQPAARWAMNLPPLSQMKHDQHRVSITILVLCNLFPPFLLPYAMGKLDFIIKWYTHRKITTFTGNHKRWAFLLFIIWLVLTFIGLLIFLVFYFKVMHSRH